MGAPSQAQIDDAIAAGICEGQSDEAILASVGSLQRLSDEELAAMGIVPHEQRLAAEALADAATDQSQTEDFEPAALRIRHDGWTAERQRRFIEALAETGCVSEACAEVALTARSAYKLRDHPKAAAFRAAWDHALSLASGRLSAIAFERAIHGATERYYKDGELIGERRKPSDRLLMWLLAHHEPSTYGWLAKQPRGAVHASYYMIQQARREFPDLLDTFADVPFRDCPVERVSARELHQDERGPRA